MTGETEHEEAETTDLVHVAEEAASAAARDRDPAPAESGESAESGETPPVDPGKLGKPGNRLLRALPTAIIVVAAVLLFPAFVARAYVIPSGSMETTLHGCAGCENDRVLVDRLSYRFSPPRPGQVVVFLQPRSWHNSELKDAEEPTSALGRIVAGIGSVVGIQPAGRIDLIKRVIAVGGQTVSCCDDRNRVVVDGKPLDEPYVYYAPDYGPAQQVPFGPVRVPRGKLWVMGDSRNNSIDSRADGNGPVSMSDLLGRARLIIYPFSRFGLIGGGTAPATP